MALHTVLIIEDDRFIGEMYVRSLRKAGYDVDWMVDGNDGLIAARNKPYDAILLDVMLPAPRKRCDFLSVIVLLYHNYYAEVVALAVELLQNAN